MPELDASIFGRENGMDEIINVHDQCGRASIRWAVMQCRDWIVTHLLARFQNASDVVTLNNSDFPASELGDK
jgi:hypothetical protein